VHAQGADVVPIPGTCSIKHLHENLEAVRVTLTKEELTQIDAIGLDDGGGDRYAHMNMTFHGN
jgi:aryl-alcohol dehydrogenase-like predicted oxidoreductase